MTKECPSGHELTRWRIGRVTTLVCDGTCGKKFSEGSWRWSCALCDIDFCETCMPIACKEVMAKSATPVTAAVHVSRTAAPAPSCRRPTPASASVVKETPVNNSNLSASLSTPQGATGVQPNNASYAASELASIKRDLDDTLGPGSGASSALSSGLSSAGRPHKAPRSRIPEPPPHNTEAAQMLASTALALPRHEKGGPAAEALAMLPALGLGEDDMTPPRLFSALPPLKPLGLPTAVEARMEGRREWLQQLFDDELARASRTARGEMSAMEAACGVEPVVAPHAAVACGMAAVLLKFEEERAGVVTDEIMEIETLQASGKCKVATV